MDFVLAGHEGLEALLGDKGGIVFFAGADEGVVHARAVEEVGVRRAGHEGGDGDAGIFQFVVQGFGEARE